MNRKRLGGHGKIERAYRENRGLPASNGSALVGLEKCTLPRKTPFGITNVTMTQFSIARYYGGIKFNGDSYTYLPDTDELIRDDVLKWRLKQLGEAPNAKLCDGGEQP